ncbi:DUF11 domain-containing protein [Candidatus Woesearchaeota archaeon]|nr:MAG: DUF11 domain-containing protein [Candidatus Woesearchaeota archaeon]
MRHQTQNGSRDYLLVFFVATVVLSGIGLLVYTQNNITGAIVVAPAAPLDCQFINASCPGGYTKVYAISNETNAHAELFNETNYGVNVCCRDSTAVNTLTAGTGTTLFNLSNFTNAHAGLNGQTPYAEAILLNSAPNQINCFTNETGEGTCGFGFTCVGTLSDTTNAHVANCTPGQAYNITVCCSIGGLVTRYLAPNTTSAALLTANGSTDGTLADNDSSYATQNITYLNLTTSRRFIEFTGNFNTQDVNARELSITFNDTAVAVNTSQVSGKSASHDLFLPDTINNVGPHVCPDADSLDEANFSCAGGFTFDGPYPETISSITASKENNEYRISGLTGSGAFIATIVNSSITNSNITNSSVFNSTITDSNVTDSNISNSTINNSNIVNSTINDSTVTNSSVTNSTILNSTLVNTSVQNSIIIDSTKINSTIINSSVTGSVNVNCTLVNTSESYSSCTNSTVVNTTLTNLTVINATIENGFCSSGVVVFNGVPFNCPLFLFELSPLNLVFSKVESADPIHKNSILTYTIHLRNNDNQTAVNLTLNETYPAGTTFVSSEPPADISNNVFIVGDLAIGASTTINISVSVGDLPNGTILTNQFNISYQRPNNLSFFQQNSTDTTALGVPFLATNKTADPDPVIKGNTITYTINITNNGDEIAYNTTVDEVYPNGTSFVSSTPVPSSGNSTFSLGTLANGSSTTVTITLNTSLDITNGTILNNTYLVFTNSTLGIPFNSGNETLTTVLGFPDITTTKTALPPATAPGTSVLYQITLTNNGDHTAENITLVDGYPANVTFNSSQPANTTDNATFAVPNLLPGQTFIVNISVNISSTMPGGILQNNATVTYANTSGANVTASTAVNHTIGLVSGGQGGGSNNFVGAQIIRPRTYTTDSDSFLTPYLNRKDTVVFRTEDGIHSLIVDEIGLTTLTVTIQSTPQTLNLQLADRKDVDVNGDGTADVTVVVVDIYRAQQTQLRLIRTRGAQTEIRPEEIIRAPQQEPTVQTPAPAPVRETRPQTQTLPFAGQAIKTDMPASGTDPIAFILVSIIVFLALAVAAMLAWRKTHPPGHSGPEPQVVGWKLRHK